MNDSEEIIEHFSNMVTEESVKRYVVVNFIISACPPCGEMSHKLLEHAGGHEEKTLVLSVNLNEYGALQRFASNTVSGDKRKAKVPQLFVMRHMEELARFKPSQAKTTAEAFFTGTVETAEAGYCNAQKPPAKNVLVCRYEAPDGTTIKDMGIFAEAQSNIRPLVLVSYFNPSAINNGEVDDSLESEIEKRAKGGLLLKVNLGDDIPISRGGEKISTRIPMTVGYRDGTGGVLIIDDRVYQYEPNQKPITTPADFAAHAVGSAVSEYGLGSFLRGAKDFREFLHGYNAEIPVSPAEPDQKSPATPPYPDPPVKAREIPLTSDMLDRVFGREPKRDILPPAP